MFQEGSFQNVPRAPFKKNCDIHRGSFHVPYKAFLKNVTYTRAPIWFTRVNSLHGV